MITIAQAAEKFGCGKSNVYRMIKAGSVPAPQRLGATQYWTDEPALAAAFKALGYPREAKPATKVTPPSNGTAYTLASTDAAVALERVEAQILSAQHILEARATAGLNAMATLIAEVRELRKDFQAVVDLLRLVEKA